MDLHFPDSMLRDKKWFKLDKSRVEDVGSALTAVRWSGSDKMVVVATDSQMHDRKQEYVTVIVVYSLGKGGTTFHTKSFTGEPRSLREKLTNEAWLSIKTAWEVEKLLPENVDLAVHLDVNPNEKWASSKYHDELFWTAKGQGFKVFTKPEAWAASYVAEHIAKHRNEAA